MRLRLGITFSVLALASVELACASRMPSSPRSLDRQSSPPRFAWNGVGCTSNLAWSGPADSFASVDACQFDFASCANHPRPTIDLTPEVAAKLDPALASAAADPHEGFVRVAFATRQPLTTDERDAVRCWGVIIASTVGLVHFGAAAEGSLRALAALPSVQSVQAQHERELQAP